MADEPFSELCANVSTQGRGSGRHTTAMPGCIFRRPAHSLPPGSLLVRFQGQSTRSSFQGSAGAIGRKHVDTYSRVLVLRRWKAGPG